MSVLDRVLAFCKVLGTRVLSRNGAIAADLTAGGDFRSDGGGNVIGDDDADDTGEQAHDQPVYGALGGLARPLPPEGANAYAEAVAVRTSDGLETIAMRDLRLSRAVNPTGAGIPAPGQSMYPVGYGGAFCSVQQGIASGSRIADILTIYVPYQFDGNGVATKAHAIVIDPGQGIQVVQGDGAVFTLANDVGNGEPGLSWIMSADSFGRVSASEVVIQAPKIMLKGVVYLGAAAEAGLPIALGTLSPSPSVYASTV